MKCNAYAQPNQCTKSQRHSEATKMPPRRLFHSCVIFCVFQAGSEFINFPQEQGKQNNRAKNKALNANKCNSHSIFGIGSYIEDCFIQGEESLGICESHTDKKEKFNYRS